MDTESPAERLRALMSQKFKHAQERLFAARVCSETLAVYTMVRAEAPDLAGDALYEAVIARRSGLDAAHAHTIMRRTRESVDDWSTDRVPRLRDVVKYLIVSEYLSQKSAQSGMDLDLEDFLDKRIDASL